MCFDERARGVRGLRRTSCPTTASSSSIPTTRSRACATPSRSDAAPRARARDGRHPPRFRRPGLPEHRGPAILDEAGFPTRSSSPPTTSTSTSSTSLKQQGAAIDVWGVGTRLVTGDDQPALGGVYKLAAVARAPDGDWQYKIKLSEQAIKISTPGHAPGAAVRRARRARRRHDL